MAYVGRDFDPVDVGESEVFTFDFVNDLAPGDALSVPSTTLTVRQGTDASPASRLIQVPIVAGTQVQQRIAGLLPDVIYCFTATVTTQQGNTLSLWSRIACRVPY